MSAPQDEEARAFLWMPSEPPLPGEGLLGWMLREASAQHVTSLSPLLQAAADRPYLLPHARRGGLLDPDVLAEVMMTDRDVVEPLLYRDLGEGRVDFGGVSIPDWHVESRRRRVSFETLAEDGIHPMRWEHRWLPFCPRSFEWLASRCPNASCGAALRWRSIAGVGHCPACGQAMVARRRKVPIGWRAALSRIAALLSHDPAERAAVLAALPGPMADAEPGEILDLLHVLFPVVGARPMLRHHSPYWDARPVRLAAALVAAFDVVMGWPDAMERALATTGGRNAPGGAAVAAMLRRGAKAPGLVGRLFVNLLAGMRAEKGRMAGTANAYSVRGATVRLRSTINTILRGRRTGALRGRPYLKGRALVVGLDRECLDEAVRQAAGAMATYRASEILGVPIYAVEDLAADGLLDRVTHPHLVAERGLQVMADSVRRLVDRIEAACGKPSSGCPTMLADAMKGVGGRLKPWAAAFRLILEGGPIGSLNERAKGLPFRVMVSPEAVATIRALPGPPLQEERGLCHRDILEVLNLKERASGELSALPHRAIGGRRRDGVPVSAVLGTAAARISSIEINARWGMRKERMGLEMRRLGIPPRADALGWDRVLVERALEAEFRATAGAERSGREVQLPEADRSGSPGRDI